MQINPLGVNVMEFEEQMQSDPLKHTGGFVNMEIEGQRQSDSLNYMGGFVHMGITGQTEIDSPYHTGGQIQCDSLNHMCGLVINSMGIEGEMQVESPNHTSVSFVNNTGSEGQMQSDSSYGRNSSGMKKEERKVKAWTEEEHRLFLMGLEKYRKGKWKDIAQNYLPTRTTTQVASHGYKYLLRFQQAK